MVLAQQRQLFVVLTMPSTQLHSSKVPVRCSTAKRAPRWFTRGCHVYNRYKA
jgi:hypothetical protein